MNRALQILNEMVDKEGSAESGDEYDGPIEAYGVRGMKSTPWRKTFKNSAAMNAWVEKMDAEVTGARRAGPDSVR